MTDLNKLRSEFEAIPEIKAHLDHGNVFWSDKNQAYASEFQCLHVVACYVNGAWLMFQEKAKAQAVPEDCAIVPKELHIEIALKMAKERVLQQPLGKDPVWNELVEQVYKDNLQAEQCRLIRDYREMVKASESGAEG